jgi:hypothetical protein
MSCRFFSTYRFQMHLKRHNITYDEKLHGYRESDAEQIKQLQQSDAYFFLFFRLTFTNLATQLFVQVNKIHAV